ncbi:CsbD family protein [Ramlibacter montanisoli]|uniref:CsbD family protein n=1 Tax=Ramlibacter montanisoli TaxID=2732512 RepID=A0A849K981_9BURK|nr:CsbD family protein [Ramlibacter montanisoli]NNU42657.1 CsbD family protein [Ramlibacter montanisoli]
MNQDRIQGRWKQLKGKVKEQWGKLTDDDLDVIAGRRDQLLGRIQQRHGLARDEADRQVSSWEQSNPDFALEASPKDSHRASEKVRPTDKPR